MVQLSEQTISESEMKTFKQKLGREANDMNEYELIAAYQLLNSLADILVSSWFEDVPETPQKVYTDDTV